MVTVVSSALIAAYMGFAMKQGKETVRVSVRQAGTAPRALIVRRIISENFAIKPVNVEFMEFAVRELLEMEVARVCQDGLEQLAMNVLFRLLEPRALIV